MTVLVIIVLILCCSGVGLIGFFLAGTSAMLLEQRENKLDEFIFWLGLVIIPGSLALAVWGIREVLIR